jgi:SAM-dependent methyltransferase
MQSAPVGQLAALAELFGEALRSCRPESVAILGIAGGNGLEHIDPAVTHRVCGIDINAGYLEAARERFAGLPGLELHCADLAEHDVPLPPVELVHAALIFEHAGTDRCLENAIDMVAPGGALSVVLQLPSALAEGVGAGSLPSIAALGPHFRLIDPDALRQQIEGRGFRLVRSGRRPLASGKAFWVGIFSSPL